MNEKVMNPPKSRKLGWRTRIGDVKVWQFFVFETGVATLLYVLIEYF